MDINKYKNLTLDEYNNLILQENIIRTEREILYQGKKYILDDDDYNMLNHAKIVYGYDIEYQGPGKSITETQNINSEIILSIQALIGIIEDDIKYNTETIQKKVAY